MWVILRDRASVCAREGGGRAKAVEKSFIHKRGKKKKKTNPRERGEKKNKKSVRCNDCRIFFFFCLDGMDLGLALSVMASILSSLLDSFLALLSPPLLSKFFEFRGVPLLAVLLHLHMGVKVVQGPVALGAARKVAGVMALDLLILASRPLLGVHTR